MRKNLLIILLIVLAMKSYAKVRTTQVPFTYIIDYTGLQSSNPDFRSKISEVPLTLYHVGGEMRYLGRYGIGCSVAEYRTLPFTMYERQTKDYLEFLHEKGVRWVIPYLCNQTISGNDIYRYGAWEVYDHWEDFAFLGLGPKPSDPIHWMQREPSGNLHYNYKRKCFLERHNDDLQLRFAACPNNQEWRDLCNAEARSSARLGFDGMFIDNNILHCYCPACENRFQKYLKIKYPPKELEQAFGTRDYNKITLYKEGDLRYWARTFPEFIPWLETKYTPQEKRIIFDTTGPITEMNVDAAGGGTLFGLCQDFISEHVLGNRVVPNFENIRLANPALQSPVGRLRWAETMMFWGWSIGEQLSEMREAGHEVNPDFFVTPNWGIFQRIDAAVGRAEESKDMRRYRKGATWQMYEEDSATGMIAPGVVLDYDLELRYAFACGVRAMLLPYTLSDPDIEQVHYAEVAASGGSVFVTTFRNPKVRAEYKEFFERHQDLYEGYQSAAKVALTYFFDQCHYLNIEHFRHVHALSRFLCDQQIPFDIVTEDDFITPRLLDYAVLILPNIVFMSDQQLEAVQGFINQGGKVIGIGDLGTHDLYCQPRGLKPVLENAANKPSVVEFESLEMALPYQGLNLSDGLQAVRNFPLPDSIKNKDNARYIMMAALDKMLRFKRYQETGPLTQAIAEALGRSPHLMDPYDASGARYTIWIKSAGDGQKMIIHLVNKNVPLAEVSAKRKLMPISNLRVTLPIFDNSKIKSVQVWRPGELHGLTLIPNRINGEWTIVVPKLEAYAVVEVVL